MTSVEALTEAVANHFQFPPHQVDLILESRRPGHVSCGNITKHGPKVKDVPDLDSWDILTVHRYFLRSPPHGCLALLP